MGCERARGCSGSRSGGARWAAGRWRPAGAGLAHARDTLADGGHSSSVVAAFASASPVSEFAVFASHAARSFGFWASSSARLTTMCLGRTAMAGPAACWRAKAHHGLVDRANLLHVQRGRTALAFQDQQVLQDAEDGAVRHRAWSVHQRALHGWNRGDGLQGRDRCPGRTAGRGAAGNGGPRPPPSWMRRNSASSCAHAPKRASMVSG